MDRIKELGWPAAPISDQGSTFGWVRWKKLAAKAGLRPIFGVEVGVTDSINSKRPTSDSWAFFAIDTVESINKLVEVSTNQFRYEALLTYDQANAAKGVLKIVGHRSDLSKIENDGRTYVALSPASMPGYIRQALELGFPLIASSDNRYPTMDEEALYEVIVGGGNQTYSQTLLSIEEWREEVAGKTSPENIAAAERLLQETLERTEWATLQPATILAPERPASLREMCVVGAAKIGIDLSDPVYDARMTRELDLIKDKDFEDYFYIIADLVQWSRERMIVGPARGSSCGSLVCYLLGITTVDPIPYGLIFERFIDVNRNDLPDIDIDFSDQKRHLVFEYVAQKYGSERVARLGTVAMYQPRSAVAEAGAVLGVPKWKCEAALESLIERSSGDSRALNTLEDTLNTTPAGKTLLGDHPEIMIATKMEGHPRHAGQHAAGIVLTQEPVRNFVAVDSRTGATHCDKKDAEELNLLKIDALGLTQLSVFEDALELAGLDRLFLETLPMDDQAAFDVLNKKQYSGIFQFNGNSLQGLVDQIKVDHVEDIISITALARPGPLASGGANTWVKRKIGIEPITFPHPLFTPYLEMTKGVVLYQEQVMEIGRKIGDLTWEDVTALRKAMSKSLGKEYFDQFGDKFKAGALAKGIPLELTEKIWDDMCAYGAWAFNRSHSVAYGIISYWCCWLKAHYPVEFAAATLSHEDDPAKQIQLLREMDHEGITYIPVDEELSIDKWTVGHLNGVKQLVGPVQNVKGIGPKLVQQIMSARARGEPLPPRASKLLSNPVTKIDSLWPIKDAFYKAMPNPREKNIFTEPSNVADVRTNGTQQTVMVFAILSKIAPRDENEAVNIAKRGYAIKSGPLTSLNLWIADDTGTIYAKIDRFDFEEIGRSLVERGGVGKVLYAFKGEVPPDFRMIRIKQVRLIGYIDEKTAAILDQKERAPAPEAALAVDLAKQKAVEASEGLSE
jgi:DNA polymerase III alpha subunit